MKYPDTFPDAEAEEEHRKGLRDMQPHAIARAEMLWEDFYAPVLQHLMDEHGMTAEVAMPILQMIQISDTRADIRAAMTAFVSAYRDVTGMDDDEPWKG